MEKTDIRTRFTRKTLRESLISLMKEKSILNITIREICERSGLSRSTFYAYYNDQYDLLRQIEDDTLAEAKKIIESRMDLTKKLDKVKPAAGFQSVLQYVADNSNSIQVLLSKNGDSAFQKRFFRNGIERVHELVESAGLKWEDKGILGYSSAFFIGGMAALVQEWLKNGMDTPVPDLAKMLAMFTREAVLLVDRGIKDEG
jgi:AcrR family transcriptional regulator